MNWKPGLPEIEISFDAKEYDLYKKNDPASKYADVRWSLSRGRTKRGEFPVVVAREYFRKLGYTVWVSEPEMLDQSGFILASYQGKRRENHPAYQRMKFIIGSELVEKFNKKSDEEKVLKTGNAGGGDPGMFVFRESECFFVEVKHKDELNRNQEIVFPLIEEICGIQVKIARIVESSIIYL
jgi:hypothetical protein